MLRRWLGGGLLATVVVVALRALVRLRPELPPEPPPEVVELPVPPPAPPSPQVDPPSFETLGLTRPPKAFELTAWQRKRGVMVEVAARGMASRSDLPKVTVHQPCDSCEWDDPSNWGICSVMWLFDASGKEVAAAELQRDATYRVLCLATPNDFLTPKPELAKAVVVIGERKSKPLAIGPPLTRYAETRARVTPLGFGPGRKDERVMRWELFVSYEDRLTSVARELRLVSTRGAVLGEEEIFEVRFDAASDGYPTRNGRALLSIRAPLDFVPASLEVRGKTVPLPPAQGLAAVPAGWRGP